MAEQSQWVVLAHLLRPQGRRGEILCELMTDFPDRFGDRPSVFLAPPGFVGELSEARAAEIVSFWLPQGRNEGRVVLHFSGVDSITEAEKLAGNDVIVSKDERVLLTDSSVYVSDLIGCELFDGGDLVGTVEDVQFAMTSDGRRRLEEAAPLLVVLTPAQDEVLVPYVANFVVEENLPAKRLTMSLPDGLFSLNSDKSPALPQKRKPKPREAIG